MIEDTLEAILGQDQVRGLLSQLRQTIKEDPSVGVRCVEDRYLGRFLELLEHTDAKTRKNAALLLGDLSGNIAADEVWGTRISRALWQAYGREETRFVSSSYIRALGEYGYQAYIPSLEQELMRLQQQPTAEEDKKHVRALREELQRLLEKERGSQEQPAFLGMKKKHRLLLTCEPYIRENLLEKVKEMGLDADTCGRGLRVITDQMQALWQLRQFHEIWFAVRFRQGRGNAPVTEIPRLASQLADSELLPLLRELYGDRKSYGFRFRAEPGSRLREEPKKLRQLTYALEETSQHRLYYAAEHPAAELRLIEKPDHTCGVYARMCGMKDPRFSYRKNLLPTSMSPVIAAQMVELIRPYLKEGAHIIDPFCGTGTLLIERNLCIQARDVYGVDTFGQAIEMARENTSLAGMDFYYINRNYFDFTSSHLLEEVLCEFPRMEQVAKEETDHFYRMFFDKTLEITSREAMLFLLSTEEGVMKKQLRLHKEFQLLRQIPMRGKEKIYILKRRG
jgi:tRNA G10  N-methylase Trm11